MASSEKVEQYLRLLKKLLPKGRLWKAGAGTTFESLLRASSQEFCRADDRVKDMIRETDPRFTDESLDQWEEMLGLPDECTPGGLDVNERRLQLLQKLTNIGGLSKTFYEFLIGQLGFVSTVTDYNEFRVGYSTVGERLSNHWDEKFLVGTSVVGDQLASWGWRYYFNVELPATSAEFFEVGSSVVGDPLVFYSNELIECTIKKLKPAHTGVTFTFV